MGQGGKRAGAVAGGLLAAVGMFFARGLDDCARVGGRAAVHAPSGVAGGARYADDLARVPARYGDDLGGAGVRSVGRRIESDGFGGGRFSRGAAAGEPEVGFASSLDEASEGSARAGSVDEDPTDELAEAALELGLEAADSIDAIGAPETDDRERAPP